MTQLPPQEPPTVPAIAIRGLTKDFPLGLRGVKLRAVDDLSFTVGDGEVFGLLGPNGSGKSTTIKVILGLLEPSIGTCSIFGVPSHEVRSRLNVGYLPEAPYFYRYLTGSELVRFYGRICGLRGAHLKRRVEEVMEWVGLKDAGHRRVGTYSKGMLQRVGLAQAIVHEPRLVILDEPTAGVDPVGSAEISELILKMKREGKTVLLCSHLLAQVEDICDRIVILNRGKLILEGGVRELVGSRDRTSVIVDRLDDAARADVQAFLAAKGVRTHGFEEPRSRLDRLFLDHVSRPQG
jgi:ABC-2 type transport system ATP-binding protein